VPAGELAKIKTQLLTQALDARQTPLGKGEALGDAITYHGDARYANRELDDLMAVTLPTCSACFASTCSMRGT
jgi:zinc protease